MSNIIPLDDMSRILELTIPNPKPADECWQRADIDGKKHRVKFHVVRHRVSYVKKKRLQKRRILWRQAPSDMRLKGGPGQWSAG